MFVARILLLTLGAWSLTAALPTDVEELLEYYDDGSLRRRYKVNEAGEKHGVYQEYFRNGKLYIEARFREDVLHGAYETYFEDGSREIQSFYRSGRRNGRFVERSEQGFTYAEGNYKDGLKDGRFQYRDAKRVISRQRWKSGELTDLNGIVPYPRTLTELAAGLAAVAAFPVAVPEDKSKYTPEPDPELDQLRVAALRRLMSYRYLCGLAWEMELDARMNSHCWWASKLCAAIGHLDHTPENPGWDSGEYRFGFTGTSSSNLHRGVGLETSIDGYMDDSDPSNIDRVGHRRHCLSPGLYLTGFGEYEGFSAMWSFDRSRGERTKIGAVAYPPAGRMPAEFFGSRHAWSILPLKGSMAQKHDIDIRIWSLNHDFVPQGEPLELDYKDISDGMLIFRPVDLAVLPGERYWCEIDGYDPGGTSESYRFLLEFIATP